jgi:hypothetical protein
MLDKCANPACSAKFLRLQDGRLFVTEVKGEDQSDTSGNECQVQYLWLCSSCCRTMTVAVGKKKKPQVVPLLESATAAREAS